MKKTIVIILLILFSIQETPACDCDNYLLDLPIKEMGWMQSKSEKTASLSDIIFTGVLINYQTIKEEKLDNLNKKSVKLRYEMVFKLIKSYKGDSNSTIRIRTNRWSSNCGFEAKLNTECLIFANQQGNGFYYTYRSDCCKSISKEQDTRRYHKYITFLESILNMKDGKYDFKQTKSYWKKGYPNQSNTLDLISYNIKNKKFEGEWKITDRKGRVLEKGKYKNGEKIGVWEITSIYENKSKNISIENELIEYQNGKPIKSQITIKEEKFNYEKEKYETIKIQKIKKVYEYK